MSNKLLDAALEYAAKGWPIFPCRRDKTPYTSRGVLDATTDPAHIRMYWKHHPNANIGFHPGAAGLMVLDLDPGHKVEALEARIGILPITLGANTPRGGQHLFYELDRDDKPVPPSAGKITPHVDVRSHNSYVLLAPSATDAGEYCWAQEHKPAYRTDQMYDAAIAGSRAKSEDRDEWIIEPDLPENINTCIYWLDGHNTRAGMAGARIAIEGQGGDQTAYNTAAMCKSFAVSEDRAFQLMIEVWNPRCEPPWDEDQMDHLRQKVQNAYEFNTSPPGNMTAGYAEAKRKAMFKPRVRNIPFDRTVHDHYADPAVAQEVMSVGKEVETQRFRFIDYAGLQTIEPSKWLIQGLLTSEAYAVLYGQPDTFKTFIALDIALSIATGAPEEPIWPVGGIRHGPVLYVAGEGRSDLKKRVEAWRRVHWKAGVDPDFVLADPPPSPVREDWELFIDGALAMRDRYVLVVIDTMGRSMQGLNENTQEAASGFTAMTQAFRRELGAATLGLHHEGHGKGGHARGSSVFGADADMMLRAEWDGNYRVNLTMTKQKDATRWPKPKSIELREVIVDDDYNLTSLVAVPAKPGQYEQQAEIAETNQDAVLEILERALPEVLAKNKTAQWSQSALAEAMAHRDDIDVGSASLRQRWLTRLREDKSLEARKYYMPALGGKQGYWQWKATT